MHPTGCKHGSRKNPLADGAAWNGSPRRHCASRNPLTGPTVDIACVRLAARPGIGWYSASYPTREVGVCPRLRRAARARRLHSFKNARQKEVRMPDVYQPEAPHIRDAPHISPATPAEDARTFHFDRWRQAGLVIVQRHHCSVVGNARGHSSWPLAVAQGCLTCCRPQCRRRSVRPTDP